jgi:DtxR family Mn-dependent transcriptional regulator
MIFGNPTEDPQGSNSECQGQVLKIEKQLLSELAENQKGICGVKDTSSEFLNTTNRKSLWVLK